MQQTLPGGKEWLTAATREESGIPLTEYVRVRLPHQVVLTTAGASFIEGLAFLSGSLMPATVMGKSFAG